MARNCKVPRSHLVLDSDAIFYYSLRRSSAFVDEKRSKITISWESETTSLRTNKINC